MLQKNFKLYSAVNQTYEYFYIAVFSCAWVRYPGFDLCHFGTYLYQNQIGFYIVLAGMLNPGLYKCK